MDGDQAKSTNSHFISFQDFPTMDPPGQAQLDVGTHIPSAGAMPNDGSGMMQDLQGMPEATEGTPQRSFWTVEYYQKFFNVTTSDVVERLKRSMIPHGSDNYLVTHIRPNPDLYGPFWVCVTLIFAIAISGNMANYLQTIHNSNHPWKYDFHVVSYAATCIFLYAWLLPIIIWGALKWTQSNQTTEGELITSNTTVGLLEVLCLYGYSLTIYIPLVFLLTIQISSLQWGLVLGATLLSGGVLVRSFYTVITGKHRFIYMGVILSMHLLLAVGFIMYFFHVSTKSTIDVTTPLTEKPLKATLPTQRASNLTAAS